MTDTNQQHPLWFIEPIESTYQNGDERITDHGAFYVRAPTAAAALARAEAMRAGKNAVADEAVTDYTKMTVDELLNRHQEHSGCTDSCCRVLRETAVAELARRAREADALRAERYEARAKVAELEAQVAGGAGLIAAERQRQVGKEGWTPEHDDEHADGYLAVAAAHLCSRTCDRWGLYAKHRNDRQRQLVIAGALIAAELDRLARTAPKEGSDG